MLNDDLKFLKDLQEELKTQDHDCQAAPRFWTVGDYRMAPCPEGCEEDYYVNSSEREYSGEINSLLNDIKSGSIEEMSDEAKESFAEIGCEVSASEWLEKYWSDDVELIPVREEHFVHPDTMFLTKAEAKEHIRLNHYHYSPRAHTYAMTAWRAPKVERLLKILETFDWDSVEVME
jgi:hypothetical protein